MSQSTSCLFCTEEELCPAHQPKVKKSRPRKTSSKPPVAPSVSIQLHTSPSDENTSEPDWFGGKKQPKFAAPEKQELTTDELILREAVRNLWPILSEQTKRRFADDVSPPASAGQSKRRSEVRRMLSENNQ